MFIKSFSYLLYTIAKESGEGSGESTFTAVVKKIMQQTGIRGIIVNNRITNVLREKIGTTCAEPKWAKKKSGGFGVKRLTDIWRDQTYSFKHSLMLHWFADLMNVTEEVTIHRPWGPLGSINWTVNFSHLCIIRHLRRMRKFCARTKWAHFYVSL